MFEFSTAAERPACFGRSKSTGKLLFESRYTVTHNSCRIKITIINMYYFHFCLNFFLFLWWPTQPYVWVVPLTFLLIHRVLGDHFSLSLEYLLGRLGFEVRVLAWMKLVPRVRHAQSHRVSVWFSFIHRIGWLGLQPFRCFICGNLPEVFENYITETKY